MLYVEYIEVISKIIKSKTIAIILALVFIFSSTFVFAFDNITHTSTLAPRPTLANAGDRAAFQAALICTLIEKRSSEWKDRSISDIYLEDMMLWKKSTEPAFEGFDPKISLDHDEIIIDIPGSNVCIRYYDIDSDNNRTLVPGTDITKTKTVVINGKIARQVIFKIGAIEQRSYPSLLRVDNDFNRDLAPAVRAVLFDFDGTLAETTPHVFRAFGKIIYHIREATSKDPGRDLYDEADRYLKERPWKSVTGHIADAVRESRAGGASEGTLKRALAALSRRYGVDVSGVDLVFGFARVYEAMLLQEIEKNPPEIVAGAREFLRSLKRSNIPMYIATGTTQKVVELILKREGLYDYFDAVYGVPVDAPYPFRNGKSEILELIKNKHGLEEHNQVAIIGDSKGDMAAVARFQDFSRRQYIAVGIAPYREKVDALVEAGADFVVPNLTNWRQLWKDLGIPSYQDGIDIKPRPDGMPYQFIMFQAYKTGEDMAPVKVDSFTAGPFVSDIIEAIRQATDIRGPPVERLRGFDFNRPLGELLPALKAGIETDNRDEFMMVIDGVSGSRALSFEEKKKALLTIYAWSRFLPNTIKKEAYHSYSFEQFASAIAGYAKATGKKDLQVAVLGAGDGLAAFQYKHLLRSRGDVNAKFTQFEISDKSIERSRVINPEDEFVLSDLSKIDASTMAKYRGKFDVIDMNNVLHELFAFCGEAGVMEALKATSAFLKPGGMLVFRDGVYPKDGAEFVRIEIDRKYEEAFLYMQGHFNWPIPIQMGVFDNDIVIRKGDLAKFLTKLKFLVTNIWNNRYPLDDEMRQVYCYASPDDFRDYMGSVGLKMTDIMLGNEGSSLAMWKEAVHTLPPLWFQGGEPGAAKYPSPLVSQRISTAIEELATANRVDQDSAWEHYKEFMEENVDLIATILKDSPEDILVRIAVEELEALDRSDAEGFLAAIQSSRKGHVELYYRTASGEQKVPESVYKKYGLRMTLPGSFARTRENTITLFSLLKGEVDRDEAKGKQDIDRLLRTSMGGIEPAETQIVPVGLQNDPVGVVRGTVIGLRLIHIARQTRVNGSADEDFVRDTLNQYSILCNARLTHEFKMDASDILNVAAGGYNDMLKSLHKLIRVLPIAPIDPEELRRIYEHVRQVITAA